MQWDRALDTLHAVFDPGLDIIRGLAQLQLERLGLGIGFLLQRIDTLLRPMHGAVQVGLCLGELGLQFGIGCTTGRRRFGFEFPS